MSRLSPMLLLLASLFLLSFLFAGTAHAQQDITPPTLLSVSFDPQQIDTGKGPATITVTVHVADDLSGMSGAQFRFGRPGTTQTFLIDVRSTGDPSQMIAGDALDGIYREAVTLPRYSAYGNWELSGVGMDDRVGNRVDYAKPQGDALSDERLWPSLYNGFVFAVGQAAQAPTGLHLFMPSLATN